MAENEFEVSGDREFDWSPALRTVSAEGYDPYSQFSKFATGFRPSERQALNKLYEPLSARYALGGVGVPAFQGYGLGGQAIDPRQHEDFRSYLTGYDPSGSNRMSFNTMLSRAQRARDISKLSSTGFEDFYGGLESSADKTSASWARYMYETSPDAAQNQMKLAQLLALQRPDGSGGQGEYGGIMRSAISSAMDEIYNARIAQDKSPNRFLDWYLSKTGRRGNQTYPADYGLGNVLPSSQVMDAQIAEDMMRGDIPTAPSNLNYATVPSPVPVVTPYNAPLSDPMFGAGNTTAYNAYQNVPSDYGLSNVMPTVLPTPVPTQNPYATEWRTQEDPMEKIRRLQIEEDIYRMGGGM